MTSVLQHLNKTRFCCKGLVGTWDPDDTLKTVVLAAKPCQSLASELPSDPPLKETTFSGLNGKPTKH